MPKRSSTRRPKRPTDLNVLAAMIARQATGEAVPAPKPTEPGKDPLAVELGRRGGLKGGRARAEKLSPKKRREIAKKAARARWQTMQ